MCIKSTTSTRLFVSLYFFSCLSAPVPPSSILCTLATACRLPKWGTTSSIKSNNSFPIYQDIDAKLADQLNIPNGYQFHGQVVHYPALIILNKKGEEVFRYIGKNNSDRFSFDKLKMKIEELNN